MIEAMSRDGQSYECSFQRKPFLPVQKSKREIQEELLRCMRLLTQVFPKGTFRAADLRVHLLAERDSGLKKQADGVWITFIEEDIKRSSQEILTILLH